MIKIIGNLMDVMIVKLKLDLNVVGNLVFVSSYVEMEEGLVRSNVTMVIMYQEMGVQCHVRLKEDLFVMGEIQ